MSDDLCLYEVQDGVALLTLNRPHRNNAWNAALGTAYFDRLAQAGADGEVRAIVVTGAGKSFCPGADFEVLTAIGPRGDDAPPPDTRPMLFPVTVRKPVVAAINGACAGLGLVHALLLDVRFASDAAKFTTAFARRGLVAEYSLSWTLPRIVGLSVATDLMLSARTFGAAEAKELGVVNHICPPDQVLAEAMAYAKDLAANVSPASMATIKRQIQRHLTMSIDEAVADTMELMKESLVGPDFNEGVHSYLDKRQPAFSPLGEGTQFTWMR